MTDKKKHCRCTICGFIRFNKQDLSMCPKCRNKRCMIDSLSPKKRSFISPL